MRTDRVRTIHLLCRFLHSGAPNRGARRLAYVLAERHDLARASDKRPAPGTHPPKSAAPASLRIIEFPKRKL